MQARGHVPSSVSAARSAAEGRGMEGPADGNEGVRAEGAKSERIVKTLARVGTFGIIRNFAGPNPFADSATLRDSQIVVVLKIEPKLRGQTEVLPQAKGGVSTDGTVSLRTS